MSENKIDKDLNRQYEVEIETNNLKESQAKTVMHIQAGLFNEFVQEGAYNELNKLLNKFTDEQLQNILTQRNYLERVPLHIACIKGNLKIIKLLVDNHNKFGISLDLIDQNKDTPFNLACSHGSYNTEKIYQIYALSADFPEFAQRLKNFLNQKHKLINYLLNCGVDVQKSVINGKMNPLHWAIYYGDFESGVEIFNSYPEIMFYKNERKFTPLETIFENKLVKVAKFASKSLVLSIIEIFLQKLLDRQNFQSVPTQSQDNFDKLIEIFQKMIINKNIDININFDIERRLNQRKQKIQLFHERYIHKEIKSTKKIFTDQLMKQLIPDKKLAKKQINGLQQLLQKKLNEQQNKQSLVKRLNMLSKQKSTKDPTSNFTKSMKEMNDNENYDSDQAEEFGTNRNIDLMDDDFEEFKKENAKIEENLIVEETKENPFNIGTKFANAFAEQKIQSNFSIEKVSDVQSKNKSDIEEEDSDDDKSKSDFSTIKEKKQKKGRKHKKSRKKKKSKRKKKKRNKKEDSDDDSEDDKKSNESLYIDSYKEDDDEEDEIENDFPINAKEEQKESLPYMQIIERKQDQIDQNQEDETQIEQIKEWQQPIDNEKQGLQVNSQMAFDNRIQIYDEKESLGLISKDKSLQFLHKLLILLARTELSSKAKLDYSKKDESYNMKLMRVLIEQFGVNPFYIAIKDYSAFHLACKKGYYQMIDYFTNTNFTYIGSQRQFNINYQITKRRGRFLNTSIHLATEQNNREIVKYLIQKEKNIQYANFQNCFPLEMNQQQFYIKKNKKIIDDKDNLLLDPQLMKLDLQDFSISFQIYQQYDYLIIYNLREQNIESSLIYNQLARLRQKWTWDGKQMRIKYFEDFRQNDKKDYKICYFLIGFPLELIQKMADDQDMKIYNKSKKFIQTFEYAKRHKYEKFQDYHKHFLIERMLYTELDMFHLIKNNLVTSMIPLHQFRTRYLIQQNWQKEKYEIFFDFYKTRTELKDLRPLNSLASYYGCDYAFHISFTAQFTSFLVVLFFIGLIIQLIDWIQGFTKLDFRYNFIYCISLIIWLFMTNKFWRRRENEYALVWNTIQYEKRDNISLDYRGIYTIDPVNQQITKINNIPSKTRRFLSDILLAIIGGGLIVAQFLVITQMQSDIEKMTENEIKTEWKFDNASLGRTILSASVGILNSILIFIWTFIYNFVSQKLVVWENHKYESDNESSYISKSFLFQWVLAYINLFYYAFYLQSVDILATNFITLFFSKNILFLILNDFIPHMIFLIKKKLFLKKWIVKRKEEKINRIKKYYPHLINENHFTKNLEELTEKEKRLLQKVEKTLISEEQVYINVLMPKPVNIDNLWLFFILQFGYIAYFSISFPIITVACIIMNVIHIFYTFYSFNYFMQRIKSKIARNIGIWNAIVLIMIISAFFINVLILNYTTRASIEEVFDIESTEDFVRYYQKIYEIEHLFHLVLVINQDGFNKQLINKNLENSIIFRNKNKKKQ